MKTNSLLRLEKIIAQTLEELREGGIPNNSSAAYSKYFNELLSTILVFLSNETTSVAALEGLESRLKNLRKHSRIGHELGKMELEISGSRTELSKKMYGVARGLTQGNVQEWIRICASAEATYRESVGGSLPSHWRQTKSNIKRMLEAGMDLSRYASESAAKNALLGR